MSDDRHPSALDGLGRWLADDADAARMPGDEPAGGPRPWWTRRWLRVAGLIAPWVVAAGVLASNDAAVVPPGPTGPALPAASPAAPSTPPRPPHAPNGTLATGAPTGEPAPATGTAAPPAAAPTAVRLVRDAVTGDHGARVTAVDVAAPEPPTGVGPGAWLVRVHAVVLRGDRTRWRSATHEVWAVPVGGDGGAVVGLEQPWRVTRDAPRVRRVGWTAAAADHAEVRAALRRAGLHASGRTIERHPTIAGLLRVPVAWGDGRGHVWLRDGSPMRVLGATGDEVLR